MFLHNNINDKEKILPIHFYSASDRYQQEPVDRPLGTPVFHQILFVIEGEGLLYCRGRTYPLHRGCAFFTAVNEPSKYLNTNGLVTAFLTACGNAVWDLLKHYNCDGFLFYDSIQPEEYIAAIERLISAYLEHKRQGLLSAMTYAFYTDFFEYQHRTVTGIEKVSLYIEKNFSSKLSLQQLANIGSMSVSKLCHDFKSVFGVTVFQYILDRRLSYAQSLLLTAPLTTTAEAAAACGFDDVSYFCRAYKKKFNCTPKSSR